VRLSTSKNLIYTATIVRYLESGKPSRFNFENFENFNFLIECGPTELKLYIIFPEKSKNTMCK